MSTSIDVQRHLVGACDEPQRRVLTTVPDGPVRAVLVAFHPYGFDPEAVLWGEPVGQRLVRPLPGLAHAAAALGIAVVAPHGVGRVLHGRSLAWGAHLDATAAVAATVTSGTGCDRLVAAGLSLGGLEALVFAARHPVAAVVAVNPVVDIAAWHHDIVHRPVRVLRDMNVPAEIAEEIGGAPAEVPHLYAARSPLSYCEQLRSTQVRLVWSPEDDIIPNQATRHAGLLAQRLRAAGGTVDEQVLTCRPVGVADPGRVAHESFDHWAALGFLHDAITPDEVRGPGIADDVEHERSPWDG